MTAAVAPSSRFRYDAGPRGNFMTENGDARSASFSFLTDDLARQRDVARGLLVDVEALDRLLARDTAALGTDEVLFLRHLRGDLLSLARNLADNVTETERRASRALRDEQA